MKNHSSLSCLAGLASASLLLLTACFGGGVQTPAPTPDGQGSQGSPSTSTTITTSTTNTTNVTSTTTPTSYKPVALLWEATRTEGASWSRFLKDLFSSTLKDTINAADDMIRFCPNFNSLNDDQKINTWGMLISGVAKYESAYDPLSRMQETTMGTDPVTNLPVYSEGLLQLSYQDITGWPFCKFDWNQDKYLNVKDPRKTILVPETNLDCGARILAAQVAKYHKIVISKGVYWATLKENGKYQKINEISNLVRGRLSFCL